MKIQVSFEFRKKSDLYLMKKHIGFEFKKKIRSLFNENIDQFFVQKKKNFDDHYQILKSKKKN